MQMRMAHQTRHSTDGRDAEDALPCYGESHIYDTLIEHRGGSEWRQALTQARVICSTCPIALKCLGDNRDEEWARAIITNRSRNGPIPGAIKHGTDTGYSRHRKAGEEACDPCKVAHREAVRARKLAKRRANPLSGPPLPVADEVRQHHNAYGRGIRTAEVIAGEREYQRIKAAIRRAKAKERAA